MKAMIWKELRENLKWAVLAMIGLGLAEIYGLYYWDPYNNRDNGMFSLDKSTFLMATTFGCALTGLFLGFLQILPEQRRDQWATLLHRPVTRGVILRGKVVAGLVLYLFATVPPFLVCIWLVAAPGHIAPFVPGTMFAPIADLSAGMVYYFAALFLALQRGSWFGARVLGLFAAVHLSIYVTDGGEDVEVYFHSVIEAAVLMGLAIFIAAWGAILGNGPFRVRPWLGKIALIVVVLYGLFGLGDVARMLLTVGTFDQRGNTGPQYKFTKEGIPLIVWGTSGDIEKVADLDGKENTDPRYRGRLALENILSMQQVAHLIGDPHGLDLTKRFPRYRSYYTYFSPIEIQSETPLPIFWFYLPEAKYFIGFNVRTCKPVEIVDRTGFKPWGTKPQPFQYDPMTTFSGRSGETYLLNEGKTVHVINLVKEKMFDLASPDGAWIFHANMIRIPTAVPNVVEEDIVLVTFREILVYDLQGNPIATLPFHHDVDEFGTINFSLNLAHDRFFVEYGGSRWIDWSIRHLMTSYFEIVDRQGNVLNSYVLPALPIGAPQRNWVYYALEAGQTPAFWYGTVAYQNLCSALGIGHYDDRGINPFYPEWSHPPKVGLRILLVSLLWVPIAILLARRAHFSWQRTWLWAVFVFAFNFTGLLAFLLIADWPVRVPCPQCHRKRPIEETLCPHCHAVWPSPKPTGIEILDEKVPVAETVT